MAGKSHLDRSRPRLALFFGKKAIFAGNWDVDYEPAIREPNRKDTSSIAHRFNSKNSSFERRRDKQK
jgi:hypothetical protein